MSFDILIVFPHHYIRYYFFFLHDPFSINLRSLDKCAFQYINNNDNNMNDEMLFQMTIQTFIC